MSILVKTNDLSKSFGSQVLFENSTFEIHRSDCIGVLGPNGCGKTTLFKVLLGWEPSSFGHISRKENIQMRYLDQVAISQGDVTLHDFFQRTTQPTAIQQEINVCEARLQDPSIYSSPEYEDIIHRLHKLKITASKLTSDNRWDAALDILDELDIKNLSKDTKTKQLSGGERQKIAIASIFAQSDECDVLYLDEPTNHLDIPTIEWLEGKIADFPNAVLIISHDRYLLDDLVDRVFEFEGTSIICYDVAFQEYEEQKQMRHYVKNKSIKKQNMEIKRQKNIIEKMNRRNKYDRQIASKVKRLEKESFVENEVLKSFYLKFRFKSVFKSGKNVADGNHIRKTFDDTIILDDQDFEILSGQKIGLIGPNGCGKTTFLKILTGEEQPDSGIVQMSSGVKWGYFDQAHLSLKSENTLIDELRRDHMDISENDAKALLGQFNFKGDIIFNKVGMLSGGERARLAILRLLVQPYNFLMLDEPTNHMDMESKHSIEQAINTYGGTVLVVSHDRRFLDRVTDTIFFMSDGNLKTYKGNYSKFKLQRQEELLRTSDARHLPRSIPGVDIYIVRKSFTNWTTKTKHNVGDTLYIGDHNQDAYQYAIDGKWIQLKKK
ncbi:MAG: ABC-F family ATP-binding cassette domain-containing protein [Candidatus Thermoplasmatota archaeon]|nr:ABC-F family ATP-binding cassette domain-containing protein [Candidatus Thermoplasmatota archaeon]